MSTALQPAQTAPAPQPEAIRFNLSLAMAGEPLITRDGRPVTRFTVSRDFTNYPIRAVVDGKERCFTIAGTYWIGRPDPIDLFLAVRRPLHERDEECTIDPETEMCRVCGVDHSGQCPACLGRGFHTSNCSASLA